MKHLISVFLCFAALHSSAQITITSADMPVSGDTLRYSLASPLTTSIDLAATGAGATWNFPLSSVQQRVDTYQNAAAVNILYAATIGLAASGYKVADSFPIPGGFLPVSIQQVYNFFLVKTSPSRYEAKAFAATISGIPTPINYTTPDVWYFFPLAYPGYDTSRFKLSIALPGLGSLKQAGVRRTTVDGWGTITTPYYITPANCIRVRSEIDEVDSLGIGSFPAIGLPRKSVEYKWLVNGDHYPALWVTTTVNPATDSETISAIRYRDARRDSGSTDNAVAQLPAVVTGVNALPNPSAAGLFTLQVPAGWKQLEVEIFDMQSRRVAHISNTCTVNLSTLPAGTYLACITAGTSTAYVKLVK